MNPSSYYYHYHTIPPYGPIFPVNYVPAPRPLQAVPVHYATGEPYPQFVSFLDDVFILDIIPNTSSVNRQPMQNHYMPAYTRPEYMSDPYDLLEETFMIEADSAPQRSGGSGLSEEDITRHLHVCTAARGKTVGKEEITCSICLCDSCENSDKIARLGCGHQYHAACIRSWLLTKNTCPMCRCVALRV